LGDHRAWARPGGKNTARLLPSSKEDVMESRITSKQVTFRRPFTLTALDGIQPPGIYTIRTEEEMLDALSFIGWRQISTTMVLHRDGGVEYAAIDPHELSEALVRDGDQGTDPPASPAVAAGNRRARDQMRRGGRS
jgi:hypothetical protein